MARRLASILAFSLALVCGGIAQAQTTITLRAAAEIRTTGAVRLADIAEVIGPESERLREAVVINGDAMNAADTTRGVGVTIEDVRRALDNLPRVVNWGRVTLTGSTCLVRRASIEPETSPMPAAAEPLPGRKIESQIASLVDGSTARGVIAERLARLQGVDIADMRIKIVATNRADGAFLDAPVGEGDRLEVQPGAGLRSARTALTVDVYRGDRLKETRIYSTELQVRREVLVAAVPIERDQTLTQDDVRAESRWLNPGAESGASPEQLLGGSAKKRIEPGRVLALADFQPPVVVQRGEQVWVHCLSGQFVVKIKCRAMQAARDGQLVQLQAEGAKKQFTARMSGRGVAVIELAASEDIEPRDLTIYRATDEQGRAVPAAPARKRPAASGSKGEIAVIGAGAPARAAVIGAGMLAGEPDVRSRARQPRAVAKR